jgi:hypothetical protein
LAAFLAFGLPDFLAGDSFDFLGRFLGAGGGPGGGPKTMVFSLPSGTGATKSLLASHN